MRTKTATRTGRGLNSNNRPGRESSYKPFKLRSTKTPGETRALRRAEQHDPLQPTKGALKYVGRVYRRAGFPPRFYTVVRAEGKALVVRCDDGTEERVSVYTFAKRVNNPRWSLVATGALDPRKGLMDAMKTEAKQ